MANILKRRVSASSDIEEKIFQSFNPDLIKKITLIGNNIDIVGTLATPRIGLLPIFKGFILRRVSDHCLFGDSDLETLEGSPLYVDKDFGCSYNNLKFLKGAPKLIGGSFNCSYNNIETLVGGPTKVGVNYTCYGNNLKTLKGAPIRVNGDFNCSNNYLQSLEGVPRFIGGDLSCDKDYFTADSYERYFPDHVGGKVNLYGSIKG